MTLLHAVTRDIPTIPDENLVSMIEAITPYVDYIQLREKSRSSRSLGLLIERILVRGIPLEKLIINDRADIAQAFGIPRTHLTEQSLSIARMQDAFPEMKFGRSFHTVSAVERELSHYDYGYLGHIFRTSEKHYPALGIDPLISAFKAINSREVQGREVQDRGVQAQGKLIAIGGIDVDTLPKICDVIDGAAVMSALFPVANHLFDIERGRLKAKALREILDRGNR